MRKILSRNSSGLRMLLTVGSFIWCVTANAQSNGGVGVGVSATASEGAHATSLGTVEAKSRASNAAWLKRHQAIVAKAASQSPEVMLLGDSITQGWELNHKIWAQKIKSNRVLNAGIASDKVEHILWRVQIGLFTTARPKIVVLMAGINNLAISTPEQITGGLAQIIDEIHGASPATHVLLMGILPSGEEAQNPRRGKIRAINSMIAGMAAQHEVQYLDAGSLFLAPDGSLTKAVSFDGVHLTREGYTIWATALRQPLKKISRG